jgi:hypothetical protein
VSYIIQGLLPLFCVAVVSTVTAFIEMKTFICSSVLHVAFMHVIKLSDQFTPEPSKEITCSGCVAHRLAITDIVKDAIQQVLVTYPKDSGNTTLK